MLVTNTRDFVLVGEHAHGNPAKLETFRLADSAAEFEKELQHLRAFATKVGPALAEPRDLARLLPPTPATDWPAWRRPATHHPWARCVRRLRKHGREVRGRQGHRLLPVDAGADTVLWRLLRLGAVGPADPGSYWAVQLARCRLAPAGPGDTALFQQLSDPGRLQPLGLVEVLDWTAAALDRVDREAFFDRFNEGEAVPYFYEPFLEAFDPALRKQLGV